MPIVRLCIPILLSVLLAGCETTPQRPAVAAPPVDPARAALTEADRAYRAEDDAKALALYLPFARNGQRDAQFRVARIYTRNKGVPPSDREACNWWEAAANQNEPVAANNFGRCFESGNGREKSYPLAAQWYRRAADGGNAYGMYNLGLAHEYGRGVTQSFEEAANWFRQSLAGKLDVSDSVDARRHLKRCMNHVGAARGDPQAQHDLAIDLFNGHAPEVKDVRRAVDVMRQAALGNLPEALYIYAAWLHGGFGGVKADLPQAATLMKKAADAGHEQATIRFASITLCGIGVKKDAAAGERVLKRAIDNGSWLAMSELSEWYTRGDCGFRKDAALGKEWRAKADAAQRAENERRLQRK